MRHVFLLILSAVFISFATCEASEQANWEQIWKQREKNGLPNRN